MQPQSLHEALARDRRRYERLLLSRLGASLSAEDAEDVVSEALLRVQLKSGDPPRPGSEGSWFARIVLNLAIDYLRARDGRRRNGSSPRPSIVPLSALEQEPAAEPATEDVDATADLEQRAEREQIHAVVSRAMNELDAKDAELIQLRHIVGADVSRDQVATMAGLTVGEFRWRYARAWRRFVDAIAMDAPTERCTRTRRLLGAADAGLISTDALAEIDAHTTDCVSCRVFARESYRALEALPFVPAAGAMERWVTKLGAWWDRSGPEATTGAGAAAAGAGIWSLLTGGSVGVLKLTAIVCSATAVTAGLCAGVVAVMDEWEKPRRAPAIQAKKRPKPRATPTATPTATPVPTPRATATPTATPRPQRRTVQREQQPSPRPQVDTSGESEIPASAPEGATEFNPGATTSTIDPAPATDAGGGEFSP